MLPEERIAELESVVSRLRAVLAERDAEIARLCGWLRVLRDGLSSDYEWYSDDSVDRARRALAGEEVPE